MRLNAKRVSTGAAVAALAVAGLAGGGVALASARTPAAPATSAAATAQPYPGWCLRDPGDMPGMPRTWTGQQPVMGAAATYLGMSPTELRSQLLAGRSLADVARAHGKPVSGLEDAILAAMASRINASSGLTAGHKTAMLREMRSHLDEMVNTVPRARSGMGWMSPRTGMGMWSSQEAGTDR
jgi:hypothetical protein